MALTAVRWDPITRIFVAYPDKRRHFLRAVPHFREVIVEEIEVYSVHLNVESIFPASHRIYQRTATLDS